MTNHTLAARLLGTSAYAALLLAVAQPAHAQTGGSQVETVTVTANRIQAQEVKREAPNLVEVQPYTEIRKLPDVNIAEALQRIPGISMESDTGEGRFINIRGMDADLNGTTFDGVVLTASNQSSPQSGARAVAFDAFPSAVVGGVEVIKSLTPDMDATGLGGVVNLVPRAPASNGNSYLDVGVGAGIEPLRERPRWQSDVTGSTTFDFDDHQGSDRFTVVGTLAFDEDWRGIDDLEEGYANDIDTTNPNMSKIFDNVQYRWYEYHRTRRGAASLLSFSPDANNTFYVRALYAGYSEHSEKQHLEIHNMSDFCTDTASPCTEFSPEPDPSTHNYYAPNGVPLQTLTDADENVSNALFVVGGHSIFGALKADYRVSWTRGQDDFPVNYGAAFAFPDSVTGPDGTFGSTPVVYNNINSPNFPTYNATAANLSNPANYFLGPGESNSSLNNGPSKSFESEWGGSVDFTLPLNFFDHDGTFKFGGMVRERIRGVSSISINYTLPTDVSLAGLVNGAPHVYYDNHYNIGPMLNSKAIENLPGLIAAVSNNINGFEHDDENVYAGYAMYTTNFGPWGLLAGVRYESTDAQYNANLTDSLGNVLPNVNKANYTNFFPSLQTKYQLDDQTQFRAAFSTAIARPGFNQITAAKSVDYTSPPDITINTGNPNLKPTTGKSLDLDVEHYMPDGGLATVGVFYKYFSNYIIPTQILNIPNANDGLTLPPGFAAGVTTLNSFQNIGDAFNEGAEASYTQKFVFLPDPFDGLGVEGNVTYNHARGAIRVGERHQLPQDSPFNFNAGVFYEKGPISLRVAASYVSANIFSVGSDAGGDVYAQPRFRLDLGSTYDVTDNVQFYFDAKNLTNTLLEFTQTDSKFYPIQREFYGPTFFFGVRVRFGEASEKPEFRPGGGDED